MSDVKKVEVRHAAWRDDRGWGIDLLEAESLAGNSIGNLHVVSIKPGCIRGNHYHTKATEWMLIFGGPAKVAWKSGKEHPVQETLLDGKDSLALFEVPPGIRHAILNTSGSEIYLISINSIQDRGTVSCSPLFDNTTS